MVEQMKHDKRDEMFRYIRDCILNGLKRDEIIELVEINYSKRYKIGSWKYLRKIAIYGLNLQERQAEYNAYMKKCQAEYMKKESTDDIDFMEQIKYKGETKI